MSVLTKENSVIKNLSIYIGSNVIGQMIGILVSPILTRIFSPEAYGIQSIYLAFISMLCVASTLSYHNAVVVSEKHEEMNVIALSFIILFIFTLSICILLICGKNSFLIFLNCEEIIPYSFLIPISVFCISSYNILNQYAIKYKTFSLISKTKIRQNLCGNTVKILLGLLNFGTIGLLIGNVFAQSVGVIGLLKYYVINIKKYKQKYTTQGIIQAAKRYRKFAYISTPCNYIYTLGSQIPILMLSILFGKNVSGYYGLAYNIVFLPCNLIGLALSQVFFAEIAEKRRESGIISYINTIIKKTFFLALIPFVCVGVISPYLFNFIYGKDWILAGEFARILAIQSFFYFLILPVNKVFEIFQKQQYDLFFNILRIFVLILIFFCAKKVGLNAKQTMFVFSVFGGLLYVFLIFIMEIMLRREVKLEYY